MSWTPLPVPHAWTPASAVSHSVVFTAADVAGSAFRVTDGTLTGSWSLKDLSWTPGQRDVQFSGPRGTLGRRAASSRLQDAPLQVTLRLWPDGMDDAAQEMSDLARVVDLMARHGGQVTLRRTGQAYRQHFQVTTGGAQVAGWTPSQELDGRTELTIQFTCGPYVCGDPMEVVDRFTTDTRTDYTYDAGSSTSFAVADGMLQPTGTAAAVAVHTATGHRYGDHGALVSAQITSTLTTKVGVVLKRVDASNRLEVYVDDTGAASRLRIDKVVAGVATNLASLTLTRLVANQRFSVQGRVDGNRVYADYWVTPEQAFTELVGSRVEATLTSAEAAVFGRTVLGQAGLVWDPAATGERVEELHIQPYAYGGQTGDVGQPAVTTMHGAIPGDAPAACDVEIHGDSGGFALIGWAPRPLGENLAPAGDLDDTLTFTDPGAPWTVAGVTGVTGAATSMTVAAGGYRSRNCLQVVAPATANVGAALRIARRFRAGTSYTVSARLRSAAATTNARVRLGVSGDIASTTAVALSTTWTEHTTTWTPTTDVDLAYFAAEITAATATTFQVDSVTVYETDRPPATATQTNGRAGQAALCILDASDATGYALGTHTTGLGAGYRNGTAVRISGAGSASLEWPLDPDMVDAADHTGSCEVEVWGRFVSPAWAGTGTVKVGVLTPNGTITYSREYGSVGKPIPASYTNLSRLGTVAIPTSRGIGQPGRTLLTLIVTTLAGGNFDIDYLILVPAWRRALGPTGKQSTGYPLFLTDTSSSKIVRADLTGYRRPQGATGWGADTGLGGNLIELDPGENAFLLKLGGIPDQTDANPADPGLGSVRVRWSPVPRWHFLRDA